MLDSCRRVPSSTRHSSFPDSGERTRHDHHAAAALHPRDGKSRIPGWFWTALDKIKAGEYGQTDARETFDDATQLAIRDQERAGIDVVCDGEMRRFFFVQTFYGKMDGLEESSRCERPASTPTTACPATGPTRKITVPKGLGHGRGVPLSEDPDRPARQGHVPGTGDAVHPHPDAARRRVRQRPPGALLGPRARGQRRAQGPRRRRRRRGSRSTSRRRPSSPARSAST